MKAARTNGKDLGLLMCVDSFFLDPKPVASQLHDAGFGVEKLVEREPYPEVEHQSRLAYILARKSPRST